MKPGSEIPEQKKVEEILLDLKELTILLGETVAGREGLTELVDGMQDALSTMSDAVGEVA